MDTLVINGLRKSFGALEVLKGIDLSLEEGGFLVLLGPSGCGKSTLLSIIAGLEEASSGEIHIGGRFANDLHPKDRDIAMVFQSYALYPSMDVSRNMAFGLEMRGVPANERATQVDTAANLLGIGALLDRKPAQLSGGQRQRTAMGRALVRDPRLFLLDEPLSNLDAKLRTKMRAEIKKLHQDLGATIVYVTHDQVEAMTLASRIAILRDGEVQQVGTPMSIYENPANMFVAGFIGAPPMNFVPAHHIGNGQFSIEGSQELSLEIDGTLLAQNSSVVLGIRPESFALSPGPDDVDGRWNLRVLPEVIEPMGADTMVTFRLAGSDVQARLSGKERVVLGETLPLSCDPDAFYIFDPKTEKAVYPVNAA